MKKQNIKTSKLKLASILFLLLAIAVVVLLKINTKSPVDPSEHPDYFINFSLISEDRYGFRYYDKDSEEPKSWKGIDVSYHQKEINWEKVAKAGVDFVMIRAGYRGYEQGVLHTDSCFSSYINGALENNIAVGVYFVTQATSGEEAIHEAQYLLSIIEDYDITWPIALDIEAGVGSEARAYNNTNEELTEYAILFCNEIKKAGYTPIIYSNTKYFTTRLNVDRFIENDIDLWYASYRKATYPDFEFTIWQYSETGKIPGIDEPVDLNISFKNYGAALE